ncbi:MAG: rhamnogalacturonan acetylesterase [Bacteroidetes bacterium]|nr:rhamnogalacturonan acetylesterase [Bacteroidota bacterium]
MIRRLFPLIFIGLFAAFVLPQKEQLTIHLVGDSTMADKPDAPEVNPERGWGQLLHTFFTDAVLIRNHALNGRSSKSFREEGHWDKVLDELKFGDYVFIQFGHNDSKYKDPARYTNPYSTYRSNLEHYVNEARAAGANPVLCSSIVRRKFNEHGVLVDTHDAYPFVVRLLAADMEVPFLDMQLLTENYIREMGEEDSKEIYLHVEAGEFPRFPEGKTDNTHLSLKGAMAFAELATQGMRELELPIVQFLKDK